MKCSFFLLRIGKMPFLCKTKPTFAQIQSSGNSPVLILLETNPLNFGSRYRKFRLDPRSVSSGRTPGSTARVISKVCIRDCQHTKRLPSMTGNKRPVILIELHSTCLRPQIRNRTLEPGSIMPAPSLPKVETEMANHEEA